MKKKRRRKKPVDPDMPIGKLTIVEDFLPPPDKLVFPEIKTVKVTLTLTEDSVKFFKAAAKRNKSKYQQMIRNLLDLYAKRAKHY